MSKVIIIGGDASGKVAASALTNEGIDAIIISGEAETTIRIDGNKFRERPKARPSKGLSKMMMIATMFGGLPQVRSRVPEEVNIIEEFALIQKKKSNLSRSQREAVVAEFHATYEKL